MQNERDYTSKLLENGHNCSAHKWNGNVVELRKSKEELMSGDWYLQGDDRLSLSLYDDGTCQIRGDYGQGKWSIVDEDTLKLTDFYGETRTYPITAVDDNSLELELPNGETVTYYHTAEEALKH